MSDQQPTPTVDIDSLPEYTIRRITYANQENGWAVLKTECGQTLVGSLAQLNIGDTLKVEGVPTTNQYGEQLKVNRYYLVEPSTTEGILAFLKGGAIKGLGPKKAHQLVKTFGTAALDALADVDRLSTIPGIGKKTAQKIADSWKKNRFIHQIYIFLQGHGITSNQATRIFKAYGNDSIQKVKQNPFRLAYDIDGIGFITCDKIAASMGFGKDHPERIKAGCLYFIDQMSANEGHVYVVGHEIAPVLTGKLGVTLEQVSAALLALVNQNSLLYENVQGEGRYYLPKLHRAEKGVADHVLRIARGSLPDILGKAKTAIAVALEENSLKLSDEQADAVHRILSSKFSVLTGDPGCGKTTTTNVIIKAYENLGLQVVLASPTGRAAKRMTELSQRPARTVHRLLEYDPQFGGFKRGEEFPLDGDVFIFDEVSMLDVNLAHSLLKAVPANGIVVMVGDVNQLPSVGAGTVLRDLIQSGVVTVCQLTKIFRQAAGSKIITSAHAINKGQIPEQLLEHTDGADAYYLPREEADQVLATVRTLITNNLLRKGFRADDIQILCPQNKGDLGTVAINAMLQELLNAPSEEKPEFTRGQKTFRLGDRVIQLRNDYDKGVFNGDIGKIVAMDLDTRRFTVDFGGTYGESMEVEYEFGETDDMNLAYAMSVHKCVHPDTLVETPDGLLPIKAIASEGTIATPSGAKSYHEKFTKEKGRALKLTTKSGYSLTVSPEHGMTVWDGQGHVRVEAQDLLGGDKLRLSLGATFGDQAPPAMPSEPSADQRAAIYRLPTHLTGELAEFLGLMVADGTLYKSGFRLCKRYPSVINRFYDLTVRLFGVTPKPVTIGRTDGYEVNSVFLADWLRSIGGMNPNEKDIPEVILRAPMDMQIDFLKGLFEDGSVNLKGDTVDHIEWSNCDADLAGKVQTMLLRFGIITSRRTRRSNGHPLTLLYLYGQNAKRFYDLIGFVSVEKNERLASGRFSDEIRYGIPVAKSEAESLKGLLSLFDQRNARARGRISRHLVSGLIEKNQAPDWLVERFRWHYDDIVSIEKVECETMCVTVPDGHRFLQNGFDGWNSQGSEYPCVIMPLTMSSFMLLQRNLLYTGVTRARKFLVIVGQKKALNHAVKNNPIIRRNSALVERLTQAAPRVLTSAERAPA